MIKYAMGKLNFLMNMQFEELNKKLKYKKYEKKKYYKVFITLIGVSFFLLKYNLRVTRIFLLFILWLFWWYQ